MVESPLKITIFCGIGQLLPDEDFYFGHICSRFCLVSFSLGGHTVERSGEGPFTCVQGPIHLIIHPCMLPKLWCRLQYLNIHWIMLMDFCTSIRYSGFGDARATMRWKFVVKCIDSSCKYYH